MPKTYKDLRLDLYEDEGKTVGVLQNVIDDLLEKEDIGEGVKGELRRKRQSLQNLDPQIDTDTLQGVYNYVRNTIRHHQDNEDPRAPLRRGLRVDIPPVRRNLAQEFGFGGRRVSLTTKFGRCVKGVRKTVKARKGSSAEGAAIAICTETILHPRGRTLKRYKKGRLVTQKRRM